MNVFRFLKKSLHQKTSSLRVTECWFCSVYFRCYLMFRSRLTIAVLLFHLLHGRKRSR